MQIVREPTGDSTTRLDDIMHLFTPPMRRVCAYLPDDALRAMVERMARRKLEADRARRRELRAAGVRRHQCRTVPAPRAMTLAS